MSGTNIEQLSHGPSGDEQSEVIDEVQHVEPAAALLPEEARHITQELWASGVEMLAKDFSTVASSFILVTFSRHSAALHEAILATPLVRKLKAEGVEVQPKWANGAFVLLPLTPEAIEYDLHPRHALVSSEDDLLTFFSALEHVPYVHRKLKPDGLIVLPSASAHCHLPDFSNNSGLQSEISAPRGEPIYFTTGQLPVRNTFIDFGGPPAIPVRPAWSV